MDSPRQQTQAGFLPIYQTTRGEMVESIHYGAIAVVTAGGDLAAWYGDPSAVCFLRSAAKPLQALALLEEGGAERFQLSGEEISVICASHSGTDRHLKTIYGLQKRIDVSESDLLCCAQPPLSPAARAILRDQGLEPGQNHHNCSGKHTGMLALARLLDYPITEYTEMDHPVQQTILRVVAEICGLEPAEIILGRDGCSVPAFAMPLRQAALGWARLVDPRGLSPERQAACQLITRSMLENPFYVAGPGRFDTVLMELGCGELVSKAGAEAFQAAGIFPDVLEPGSPGLGIVLKISDGDPAHRARESVMLEVLRQLRILNPDQMVSLADRGPTRELHNQCGIVIGEGQPCFELQYG